MHHKIITLFFLCLFSVWTVHAQRTDPVTIDEIIEKLTNVDYRIAFEGSVDYMRLSEDQRIPAVKSALIQALINENERVRSIISQRGEDMPVYESEGDAEGSLRLMDEVYDLRDPTTIPALLPWCQTGDEMVDFGRVAFEPLLEFVEKPPIGMTSFQIGSCMHTLRMMVDYWGLSSFSSSERQRMQMVAEKYIASSEFFTIRDAISLATSLEERCLLMMADHIVNDDAEMAKRQVANIDGLKEIVSRALAGTLVERQYVPYEERRKRDY